MKKTRITMVLNQQKKDFLQIKLSEIEKFYEYLVTQALSQKEKGMLADSLNTISDAAKIAYLINWRYADERLEKALKDIGNALFPKTENKYRKKNLRIVFFDSWGLDSRGLSLQYIRALNSISSSILFICESRNEEGSISLREEISKGPDNKIIYLDWVGDEDKKAKIIRKEIADFGPSQILMHMLPWATGPIAAFHAFPDVPRYQINLTDHAFWLGTRCSDYVIEFRNYGATVSQEKRGVVSDRIILNPFYPIVEDNHSNQLPERNEGDVVIFTGGAYYKMYGRDGFFFDLISKILDKHLNVVFWIAGNGRGDLLEKRMRHYLKLGRVKIIGDRKDINSVFKACDIYLATYPFTGGLMAQLAAANGVPILSYTSPDIVFNRLEDIVGIEENVNITLSDLEAFEQRAAMLIENTDARFEIALSAKSVMHSRPDFELRTSKIIKNPDKVSCYSSKKMIIDYKAFTSLYLEIENYFQDSLARRILRTTNLKSAFIFPLLTAKSLIHVFLFLILKLKNKMIKI